MALTGPNCPHHGADALEYARGRLRGEEEARAEAAREACPTCRAWWETALTRPQVDEAVARALAMFEAPPRAQRRIGWRVAVRVAAAAVLMVGGAMVWSSHRRPAGEGAVARHVLFRDGAESGDLAAWGMHEGAQLRGQLFSNGLETGDLTAWTTVVSGEGGNPSSASRN